MSTSNKLHIINLLIPIFLFSACSTGIESTKTITLSRQERRQTAPSAEEQFMSAIKAPIINDWKPGKRFLVTDDKAELVFDPSSMSQGADGLANHILTYQGLSTRINPGGSEEAVVSFSEGNHIYKYSTGKSIEKLSQSFSSMDVPMLIDLDLVADVAALIEGKMVWTKSQLWYDADGNKITGRKFVPVTIQRVSPGTMIFPLKLDIKDETGKNAVLYMNIRNTGVESRTFPSLFSLKDPKEKYSDIQPEVWELIRNGKVRIGMTKEECKLSLGNPSDVNSGHDWNNTLDIWHYQNGAYLRFQDGLLVAFRI